MFSNKPTVAYALGMFVTDLPKFATALKVPVSYFSTGQMEMDELVMTEARRLTTLEAKQAMLKLIQAFCDFAQSANKPN